MKRYNHEIIMAHAVDGEYVKLSEALDWFAGLLDTPHAYHREGIVRNAVIAERARLRALIEAERDCA